MHRPPPSRARCRGLSATFFGVYAMAILGGLLGGHGAGGPSRRVSCGLERKDRRGRQRREPEVRHLDGGSARNIYSLSDSAREDFFGDSEVSNDHGPGPLGKMVPLPRFDNDSSSGDYLYENLGEEVEEKYGDNATFRWTHGVDPSAITLPEKEAYFFIEAKHGRRLRMCRYICGTWQLGNWLKIPGFYSAAQLDSELARQHIVSKMKIGFSSFDTAPHYGRALETFAQALHDSGLSDDVRRSCCIMTRYAPVPCEMQQSWVKEFVAESRQLLRTDKVDIVQLHWPDFNQTAYLDTLRWLCSNERVSAVAVTNFNVHALSRAIDEHHLPISANVVSLSVIDRRPLEELLPFCRGHNVHVFAYGVLLGGLLSEVWLGRREPLDKELDNLSAVRYMKVIRRWGGWRLFQRLLETMAAISFKHQKTIAVVAMRWALQQEGVSAVIVGSRLGNPACDTSAESAGLFAFELDDEDLSAIDTVVGMGRDLRRKIGDIGAEYIVEENGAPLAVF